MALWNSRFLSYVKRLSRSVSPRALLEATFLTAASVVLSAAPLKDAHAEQASPGFDPRQTERQFDGQQSEQGRPVRSPLRVPQAARPEINADTKPLFVLRSISLTGASAIPRERLAATYQSYLGKTVSQADLVAITQ